MDDYLAKPVRAEALDGVIERWLPAREPDTQSGGAAEGTIVALDAAERDEQGLGASEQGLDLATIAQLKDALTAEMRSVLLRTFEESLPKCLADIASATGCGDLVELRRVAHLLKGSSATLGARRLSLSCQRLEDLTREWSTTLGQEQLDELTTTAGEICPALREHLL